MKYLATALTTIFLLSGCGSSGSSNNLLETGQLSSMPENILEFKTQGDFDLSTYLFPKNIISKTFTVKEYSNDPNPKDTVLGMISSATKVFTQSINRDNDNFIFDKDDNTNIQYTLLNDRIQGQNSDISSSPIEIVRFADIGDNIGNLQNSSDNKNIACKLYDHLDTKNNFNDVVEIVCEDQDGLYRGDYFFAKDIGSILEINTICTKDSSNNLNCKNIVTQYIVPN